MEDREQSNVKAAATWFVRWFLNNKTVSVLLILLLIFLNLFLLSKISYIFWPVVGFFSAVGLPLVMASILYYLLNPIIGWMETKRIPRMTGILIVFIVLLGLGIWGIVILVPILREQTLSFLENWPGYWNTIITQLDTVLRSDFFSRLQQGLFGGGETEGTALPEQSDSVVDTTFTGIGNVVGVVSTVVIALITTPFILFYLLKDANRLPYHLMQFIPSRLRPKSYELLMEMNTQISQYVRGQLFVALSVALMFFIGFRIIGLQYALALGILAGLLNLIPFLGSFIAAIPIIIVALVAHPPVMLLKVLAVFFVEQTLEGRVIQPLILGSNLNIHPVTIIVVLLTAGNLFGLFGVILGVPAYAVLKVILTHFFLWYRAYSGLYDDDFNPAPKPAVTVQKKRKIEVRRRHP